MEKGKALWEEVQMKAKANRHNIFQFQYIKVDAASVSAKSLVLLQTLIETVPEVII